MGIPKSTAYRLLGALIAEGLLRAGSEPGIYHAGPELHRLAGVALSSLEVRKIALHAMERLAERTSHSVYLMVRSGFAATCVEKIAGNDGLHLSVELGTRRLLHCSGIAKVFLPYVPESELRAYLAQPLEQFTPSTITDAAKLTSTIASIRANGYSVSTGEFVHGARSVGVPIFDSRGSVVAALGLGGSIQKLSDTALPLVVETMKEAASEISRQLGHDPATVARMRSGEGAA